MKLKINLATKRYLNLRLVNLGLSVVFALVFVFFAVKLKQAAFQAGELKRLAAESKAAEAKAGLEVVSEAQYKALQTRLRFANQTLERKGVNWLSILDHLEAVVPDGVAITLLEPDARLQQLKISAAARSFANVRQFLENMERSGSFTEVYLLAQSDTKVGLTQQGVLFSLSCKVKLR